MNKYNGKRSDDIELSDWQWAIFLGLMISISVGSAILFWALGAISKGAS